MTSHSHIFYKKHSSDVRQTGTTAGTIVFFSQAIMYDLLGHVQGKENLLPKAVKLVMAHYLGQLLLEQPQQEHESHGQWVSEDHTMSPGAEPREVTFGDLTADGTYLGRII